MSQRKHLPLPLLALILFLVTGVLTLGWFTGTPPSDAPVFEQTSPSLADSRVEIDVIAAERSGTSVEQSVDTERRAFDVLDGMADGIEFSGRLVDGQGGSAVAGAELRLVDGERETRATSAEDGSFTLAWPRDDPAALEIVHPSYVDQRRPRAEFVPGLEIALVRSGSIEGRVTTGAGADPTAGQVSLWVYTGQKNLGDALDETTIDPKGRFRFEDVTPGLYTIGLHLRGAPLRLESGLLVNSGSVTEFKLDLPQGLTLRGRVLVRGSLEPLADAVIEARPELQGASTELEQSGATHLISAGDGTFEVPGLASGRVKVSVRAPWGSLVKRELAVSETGQGRQETFVVPAPAFLSGVVVDTGGEPVAGASVVLALEKEARDFQWAHIEELRGKLEGGGLRMVRTDDRGRFDLGAVPARAQLQLAAYPAEHGSGADRVAAGFKGGLRLREGEARTGLVLELVGVRLLEGRVVDETGDGIAGAMVVLHRVAGRAGSSLGEVRSDAEGLFRFEDVPQGTVALAARADGYQEGWATLPLFGSDGTPGASEPIELELGPAFVIAGTVLDPDGWAVPGAYVRARLAGSLTEAGERKTRWEAPDEFGRFSITGLEEGSWTLDAWAPGHRLAEGSAVTVLLPSEVEVLLTLEPRPVPEPATVTGELAMRGSGSPVAGLRLEGVRGASVTLEGTRFRITGVRPGRLRLTAKAPGVETVVYDTLQPTPGARIDLGRYEVQRTSNVGVSVLDADGKPVRGATVRLQRKAGRIAADQADSAAAGVRSPSAKVRMRYNQRLKVYGSTAVVRGTWELKVSHKGWTTVERTVTIAKVTEVLTVNLTPRGKRR